jgi:SAM-dependent methyltransferase
MTNPTSSYVASDGPAYERFIGRWTARVAERIAEDVALPIPGPLLDVGCGTGSLACALAARHPDRSVTGVDVAEPYLAFARDRADGTGIDFRHGDACALELPDDSFAAAYALIVLNFVSDPAAAAREMVRVTRSGGLVVLSGWDFRGGLVYQRLLWDTAAILDERAAALRDRIFSNPLALPDGMPALLKEAGLADVTREWVTVRMDFADFDDYWSPLLGGQGPVGGYVASLPEDARTEVETAVRRAFLSGAPDGPRSLTATAWVVTGRVP